MEAIEHWNAPDDNVSECVKLQRSIEASALEGKSVEVAARQN